MAVMLWWMTGGTSVNAQTLDARVQRKLAELEAKGVPTTQEAVWKKVKVVPKEDNAEALMFEAAVKLGLPGRPDARLPDIAGVVPPDVTRPLSPTELSFSRAWLASKKEAVQALSVALSKPDCLFLRHGYRLSRANDEYHFMDAHSQTRLLALKSLVHTGEGNVNGAIDAIADILKMSDFLRNEPAVTAYMIRLGIDSYAEKAAGQLIGRRALNEQQLDRLVKLFTREPYIGHLQLGLATEIVMSRPFMSMSAKDFFDAMYGELSVISGVLQTTPPEVLKAGEEHWRDGRNHLDSVMFLEQIGLLIDATEKPYKEAVQVEAAVKARCEEAKQKRFLMTSSFVPPLAEMTVRRTEMDARRRLLLTALAIEQHRLKNMGKLPESLDGLTKGEDPFINGAFRFRKLPRGYVVYSVGEDGVDNGGISRTEAGKGRPHDIPVKVGR
jgi:hypothetical protein